jgi:hypothetical protein
MDQFFAIFAQSFATFAVNGFQLLNSPYINFIQKDFSPSFVR